MKRKYAGAAKAAQTFIMLIIIFLSVNTVYGQNTPPIDLILLLDTSTGMSSSYDNVNNYLSGAFLTEFLRVGDTFHFIPFSEIPKLDAARSISGVGDLQTIIARIFLQYPIENTNNVRAALTYTEEYVTSLPSRPKKIVLVTCSSDSSSLAAASRTRLASRNTTVDIVQVNPGQPLSNLPSSGRPPRTSRPSTAAAPTGSTSGTATAAGSGTSTIGTAATSGTSSSSGTSTTSTTAASGSGTSTSGTAATTSTGSGTTTASTGTTSTSGTSTSSGSSGTSATSSSGTSTTGASVASGSGTSATTSSGTSSSSGTTTASTGTTAASGTSSSSGTITGSSSTASGTSSSGTSANTTSTDTSEPRSGGSNNGVSDTSSTSNNVSTTETSSSINSSSLPLIIGIIILILLILGLLIFLLSRKLRSSPNRVMSQASDSNTKSKEKAETAKSVSSDEKAPKREVINYTSGPTRRSTPYDDRPAAAENGKPVVINPSGPLLLNLFVEDQNTNIGKRNIHSLKSGYSLTVGGNKSDDYHIFLVPMPAHIGEIRRNGSQLTFIPKKTKYFPDIGSNEVKDCINKTIRIISDKNYEMRFRFVMYEDPLIALNRLLNSVRLPG